jgi:ABC-type cobalt transport system substrate-binding protein
MSRANKAILAACALIVLGAGVYLGVHHTQGTWAGVDKNVVEKFADQAGRPAKPPLINTDQGDLLLFVFLLAGAGGGFVMGYCFRGLLARKTKGNANAPDA